MSRNDGIKWQPHARVDKYSPAVVRELTEFLGYEPTAADFARMSLTPDSVVEVDGNLLTTAGLQRITNLIIGSGAQAMAVSRTAVGVGATATSETVGDAALAANGGSALYQVTDSAPTAVNGVLTCVTTFASGSANFAWNEWCWVIVSSAITSNATLASIGTTPQMINRKVASMGTKASGASWVLTTTVTLA